jgi:hypothetical protein
MRPVSLNRQICQQGARFVRHKPGYGRSIQAGMKRSEKLELQVGDDSPPKLTALPCLRYVPCDFGGEGRINNIITKIT